jgi:uncharacterized protein (TIGR02001 family)
MRSALVSTALALGLALPTFVSAGDLSVSYGATLTSRYLANGIEQTTGAAFQPWVEAEIQGFYFGAWASNTDAAITGSDWEVDLYAGYRNEVGAFSYDLSYARYYYRSPSVNCCGEIILSMGMAASDALSLGVRFAHDPVADVTNSRLSVDYAVNDKIGLSAQVGTISNGGHDYWNVGGSFAISDNFSVSAAYHDTSITKGLAVLSLDVSF